MLLNGINPFERSIWRAQVTKSS